MKFNLTHRQALRVLVVLDLITIDYPADDPKGKKEVKELEHIHDKLQRQMWRQQ